MTTLPFRHSIVRTAMQFLRPRSIADSLARQQRDRSLDGPAGRRIQAARERVSSVVLDHRRGTARRVLRGAHRVRGLPALVVADHRLPGPRAWSRWTPEARRVHARHDHQDDPLRPRVRVRSAEGSDLEARRGRREGHHRVVSLRRDGGRNHRHLHPGNRPRLLAPRIHPQWIREEGAARLGRGVSRGRRGPPRRREVLTAVIDHPPGYWRSPWPCEDAGPRRSAAPVAPGLGIRPGERLAVSARDAPGATMVVLREPGEVFLLGHSFGGDSRSWVERVDPDTLAPVAQSPELAAGPWWPGGIAAHRNGSLYVTCGRWCHRLAPDCTLLASRELPRERPYNSLLVLPDGSLVMKDLIRDDSAPSRFVVLEPERLEPLGDEVAVPESSIARIS